MTDQNPFTEGGNSSPDNPADEESKIVPPEVVANQPPEEKEASQAELPEAEFGLFFAHGGNVGGRQISKDEPIGRLTLRFGLQPSQVAEGVGRGIVALSEADTERRLKEAADLKRLEE